MKNAQLTQYPAWRIWPVHIVAKLFGVLVKVDAMPYGSGRIHRRNFPPSGKSVLVSTKDFSRPSDSSGSH